MPLKFQSHSRLINTWLKARLGQVSGLALPRRFEGFHTLGHGVSLNKFSQNISRIDDYVNWHVVDQKNLELFWDMCVSALLFGDCRKSIYISVRWGKWKCINSDSCNRTHSWGSYPKLYWSFKVLFSRSGEIISCFIFHLKTLGFDWQ